MYGPYQRQDLSNCDAGKLRVSNNCGILKWFGMSYYKIFNGKDNYFLQGFMFVFAFTTVLECTETFVFP